MTITNYQAEMMRLRAGVWDCPNCPYVHTIDVVECFYCKTINPNPMSEKAAKDLSGSNDILYLGLARKILDGNPIGEPFGYVRIKKENNTDEWEVTISGKIQSAKSVRFDVPKRSALNFIFMTDDRCNILYFGKIKNAFFRNLFNNFEFSPSEISFDMSNEQR